MIPVPRGTVVKAPVLTSVVHEVYGSCPGTGGSVMMSLHAIGNASCGPGGKSELYTLWISEAKASLLDPIELKIFFLNNPGIEPQSFWRDTNHSKV